MEMEMATATVKPRYDRGATGGTSVDPSVCGVSSDLQNLKLSESGVSRKSESDPMMDVEIQEMMDRFVAEFIKKDQEEESRNGIESPKYDLERGITPLDEYYFNHLDFPVIPYRGPRLPMECPICGNDHGDYVCPWVHDFPPGAQLLDHHRYAIYCAICTQKIVGDRCSSHPNGSKRVGPNGYFTDPEGCWFD